MCTPEPPPCARLLIGIALAFAGCGEGAEGPGAPSPPVADAGRGKTDSISPNLPGGKANYSVVYGNLDAVGTTWVQHASYTFSSDGTIGATRWSWDSQSEKGKTPYTQHRCTMDGVTKHCFSYTPTGWVYPTGQYENAGGTFELTAEGATVAITWDSGESETWSVESTSTEGLKKLAFVDSSADITHGVGFGSNASWDTFRTLPEIVAAGGPKKWLGETVIVGSNGTTITASDWKASGTDLSSFHSASWTSAGFTLHAMLPHSASVCTGACGGSRTGFIMYHLASENRGRQMVYNNWCTCLALGDEWPCYNRNMHPLAIRSFLDDDGNHRGWLFIEQQDPPGSVGYQYQLGYWDDL